MHSVASLITFLQHHVRSLYVYSESVNIVTELWAGQVENICYISDRDRMSCLRHCPLVTTNVTDTFMYRMRTIVQSTHLTKAECVGDIVLNNGR